MRLPPLAVVAVVGVIMWVVARTGPTAEIAGNELVAVILAACGLLLCVAGLIAFAARAQRSIR